MSLDLVFDVLTVLVSCLYMYHDTLGPAASYHCNGVLSFHIFIILILHYFPEPLLFVSHVVYMSTHTFKLHVTMSLTQFMHVCTSRASVGLHYLFSAVNAEGPPSQLFQGLVPFVESRLGV